jgi:hypothetical protein
MKVDSLIEQVFQLGQLTVIDGEIGTHVIPTGFLYIKVVHNVYDSFNGVETPLLEIHFHQRAVPWAILNGMCKICLFLQTYYSIRTNPFFDRKTH